MIEVESSNPDLSNKMMQKNSDNQFVNQCYNSPRASQFKRANTEDKYKIVINEDL